MRQEITRLVHDIDCLFAIRNSDMNVQAKGQTNPRHLLHVIDDCRVAFVNGDQLVDPVRKWMRAGGSDLQPTPRRQSGQLRAKIHHLLPRIARVGANIGA